MFVEPTPSKDFRSMTDEALIGHAAEIQTELAGLRAQIETLTNRCVQLVCDQDAISNTQDERRLATQPETGWTWLLAEDGSSSRTRNAACKKAVEALAVHNGEVGLHVNGYNRHTHQRVLQVALHRGVPELTQLVQAGLEKLLPFIKKCAPGYDQDDQIKYVEVFEYTLSRRTSYSLAIDEEAGRFELRTSGRHVEHSAKSLAELLTYVERRHPYQGADDED
jgi:hypothetical protein